MIFFLFGAVIAPPINIQATQSSSSAPVEVSWSPPPEGDVDITGYRIFYGSGENISVPTVITSVGLRVHHYSGEIVFLHSESDQLYSDLINVTVGKLQRLNYLAFCELVNTTEGSSIY